MEETICGSDTDDCGGMNDCPCVKCPAYNVERDGRLDTNDGQEDYYG